MERIAVYCSWADEQLLGAPDVLGKLPTELVARIRSEIDTRYLDAVAAAFLLPQSTDDIFCLYEPLTVDIFGRLCSSQNQGEVDRVVLVSTAARILPFAPSLKTFLLASFDGKSDGPLAYLSDTRSLKLVDLPEESLIRLLLALFRLLSYDFEAFNPVVSAIQIFSLFKHSSPVVKYLAVRCFSRYMQFSDSKTESLVEANVNNGPILGDWEGQTIDFRFLSLWEERRWKKLETCLADARSNRPSEASTIVRHRFSTQSFTPYTAVLGEVLVPRRQPNAIEATTLVPTITTQRNLGVFASALLDPRPVMVVGPAGSGKTSIINDAARQLGAAAGMITLHLNEQTDAKGLLGIYTASAGTFKWQPGILTKAVREGRWVVIEDLDRAPQEVLGVILPLIEHGELSIPSRKERIRAAQGFRILATLRSHFNTRGEESSAHASILGARLWHVVNIEQLQSEEIETILKQKYPLLESLIPSILGTFKRLLGDSRKTGQTKSRPIGLRDLLKWCSRIERRLRQQGVQTSRDAISEATADHIFLDAIDCFVRNIPDQAAQTRAAETIAQELHLSPQRMNYILNERLPEMGETDSRVLVGRETLPKSQKRLIHDSNFSYTRHASRLIETCAAGIQVAEPLLLVGETGIGKTTAIQHLAKRLGKTLTVVNLSQQSESSDILGGFKPVTTRSLALPMAEEFEDLFDKTFSAKRNQKFLASIASCVKKQNYQRLVLLWDEAVKMAETNLEIKPVGAAQDEKPAKRRKIEGTKYEALRLRWIAFTTQLSSLRASVSKESSKFAFAFVEGKVIQALRNGDWVLLDEINLAAPDTLESILGLLNHGDEGLPTALLSESGQVEKVIGHKDFRIFAAMNPATDSGKRDLASGVRSRFTEIYVQSPDRDLTDLLTLIETYIGDLTVSDKRLSSDLAQLYLAVSELNDRRQLTDGAGNLPHFSIRTLVRTLLYLRKHVGVYGLRRALYEGFSMSFLTMLSKESELTLVPLLDKFLLASQKNARALLRQAPRPPSDGSSYVQFRHYWVTQGPEEPKKEQHYIITPSVERNLLNLARAVSMRTFPILLQGPTSAGKTSIVEYLAKISGHKFVRINNHEHTDLQEYLGSYASDEDGRLRYQEGILVQALRQGHWVVLDELNLAPTDVLEALNRLLDDNRELFIPETQEIVRPHPDFMLFATQNPAGVYGGRKHLSRAFRNRFLELHFDDIPEEELEFILKERAQIPPSFCTKIVAVYKRLSLMRQSSRLFEQRNSFATLRDLFRWALRKAEDREQLAVHGFMLLGERVRDPVEKQAVKTIIEEVMKVKIDESKLYSRASMAKLAENSPTGIVWTPATVRLAVLILKAIENNEPVLLIGETGAGKTQVFQTVSQMLGKPLQIVNAHVNLETGDLIGAQRPIRNRAAIEARLREDIQTFLQNLNEPEAAQIEALGDLVAEFKKRKNDTHSQVDQSLIDRIQANIVRRHALFEWTDGSLVSAMKEGHHFLLDEISLADDSVLERLNSLLEPSRTILLAEKGADKASVTATPGFQFFATMNPGGDYGKRELSAALRNRLTEIWVPNLNDDDVEPILDQRLASYHQTIPKIMLEFSKWFKQSFSKSSQSQVSLRELLSWADFILLNQSLDWPVAVAQGAAMVYVDGIGANPATSMNVPQEDIPIARQQCLTKLSQLLKIDATTLLSAAPAISLESDSLKIGQFGISMVPGMSQDPNFAFDAPTTLQNAMRIVRAMQVDKPILIEGSPGVGKTTLVAALARATGRKLTRINLSEQTDLMDLFGSDVPLEGEAAGLFAWRDGPFLRAMQAGEWVLLDEMNLASQSVLEGLNACLDHRKQVYISELDQTFYRHSEFMLFAAQNPHQQGGGRKGLPASFVNRFSVVYADSLGPQDLDIITKRAYPDLPTSFIENVISITDKVISTLQIDRRLSAAGGPWDVNLRDIFRWLYLSKKPNTNIDPARFASIILIQRFRTPEQRQFIKSLVDTSFENTIPELKELSTYHDITKGLVQVGLAFVLRDQDLRRVSISHLCMNPEFLPVYEALMHCIENNWPSILVGASGCGKTICIRDLAALTGAELVEFALNGDTDSMDLVGGFEQIDPRRAVLLHLEHLAKRLSTDCALLAGKGDSTRLDNILAIVEMVRSDNGKLEDLVESLRQLKKLDSSYKPDLRLMEDLLAASDAPERPSFAWTDGILVQAMETGAWVVLNNANLCNASVLDRLNSLMEPDGFLIINEQHKTDGSPRIVKPHPNFRVFMTMDPKYGELSKAMRNRCVEIFMDQSPREQKSSFYPSYRDESRSFRLRLLDNIPRSEDAKLSEAVARIGLDHISQQDLGFIAESTFSTLPLSSDLENLQAYAKLYKEYNLFSSTQVAYVWPLTVYTDQPWDLLALQPCHPLTNEPLLSLVQPQGLQSVIKASKVWELVFELQLILSNFSQIQADAMTKKLSDLNVLERSMMAERMPGQSNKSVSGLAKFLFHILQKTSRWIHGIARDPNQVDQGFADVVLSASFVHWLRDLVQITNVQNVEPTVFQIYLQIGGAIAQDFGPIDPNMGSALVNALKTFESNWKLTFGRGLVRMWDSWRPWTPATPMQLQIVSELLNQISRFDALANNLQIPLNGLAQIRTSLRGALSLQSMSDSALQQFSTDFSQTISQLEQSIDPEIPPRSSIFEKEFEALSQYLDLSNASSANAVTDQLRPLIDLLARRTTVTQLQQKPDSPSTVLFAISSYSGQGTGAEPLAVGNTVSLHVAAQLSRYRNLPLSEINSAQVSLQTVLQSLTILPAVIGSNQLDLLKQKIWILLQHIFLCHKDITNTVLPDLPSNGQSGLTEVSIPTLNAPADHYLQKVLDQYLEPAISELAQAGKDFKSIGRALLSISMSILRLMVPDRPFDPAMELIVKRDRHFKRTTELETNMKALLAFEALYTGQSSNLRSRLVQDELSRLGDEPPSPAVARPAISELQSIQSEFDVIIQGIILKEPEKVLLASGSRQRRLEDTKILKQSVAQITSRLSSCSLAYKDLTEPIAQALQCLAFAADLLLLDNTENDKASDAMKLISLRTPLMGGSVENSEIEDLAASGILGAFDPRIHEIQRRILWIPDPLDAKELDPVLNILQLFYTDWKTQLTSEQETEEKKSRYYEYRGGDDEEEEVDAAELQEMFPTYDETSQSSTTKAVNRPRELAIKLAQLQNDLCRRKPLGLDLKKYLMTSFEAVSTLASRTEQKASPIPAEAVLPPLLLKLDEEYRAVQISDQGSNPDFYHEANLIEVRALLDLVHAITTRFKSIRDVWPEHATPQDVIKCCSELLAFSRTDALAKIITKVEKLYGFMHEWQTVASKEYSINELFQKVTDLIIRWRRLELLSWPHLLEQERQKTVEDARSWWYITYEVLIAIPAQIIQARGDLAAHSIDLADTLSKFMQTTSLGQFNARLDLLVDFNILLSSLVSLHSDMSIIGSTVSNIIEHFERFRGHVNKLLDDGRTKFEKNVKEQIQLASWKDTNVTALRESARRSHHKLFKIVRKYRSYLAQVFEIPTGITPNHIEDSEDFALAVVDNIAPLDSESRADKILAENLKGWTAKPERLRKPMSAAKSMRNLYQSSPQALEPHVELQSFSQMVVTTISGLRKETPSTLTEENKELVQHLKTRKRKLLTDTIRDVRHMGVSRNLGTEELDRQRSLSLILATTPSIGGSGAREDLINASEWFHSLLDIMPSVQKASQEHSEDLTGGEVARSVGSVQGLILLMRTQRAILLPTMSDLHHLSTSIRKIRELQTSPAEDIRKAGTRQSISLLQQLTYLAEIIKVSLEVITVQSKHSGMAFDIVIEQLRSHLDSISELTKLVQSLPSLPLALSTTNAEGVYDKAQLLLQTLHTDLQMWSSQYPNLSYVLDQIIPWTSEQVTYSHGSNGIQDTSLQEVDSTITSAADTVFVALQRFAAIADSAPSTTEDAGWLTKMDRYMQNSVKSLGIGNINSNLETAMDKLAHCTVKDGEELSTAATLMTTLLPIFEQYYSICDHLFQRYSALHRELCEMSYVLSKAFTQVASEGFCTPAEPGGGQDQSGKVESGTGLGDGEGAEDISKDVADDEDLSEFAQQENEKEGGETDAAENAVDMGQEDLEGNMDETGEAKDEESGDEQSGDDEEGDMDEEAGSVDNLDPSAVDEKLWDGLGKEDEKELEDDKINGTADQDETAASKDKKGQKNEEQGQEEAAGSDEEDEEASSADEEGEAVGREELDKTDPHLEQEQAMDLPEEMQLDGDQEGEDKQISDIEDEDFDKLSDVEDTAEKPEDTELAGPDAEQPEAEQKPDSEAENAEEQEGEGEEANAADEDEVMEDPIDPDKEEAEADHLEREEDETLAPEDAAAESGAGGEGAKDQEESHNPENAAEAMGEAQDQEQQQDSSDETKTANKEGAGKQEASKEGNQQGDAASERQMEAFKKLGDVLERWHRQQREIFQPTETEERSTEQINDTDMADADFEHLQDEEDVADTQALGSATKDQARALDQSKAFEDTEMKADDEHAPADVPEPENEAEAENNLEQAYLSTDPALASGQQNTSGSFIPDQSATTSTHVNTNDFAEDLPPDQIPDISSITLDNSDLPALTEPAQAARLWHHYAHLTHSLSLTLTEQLRLILSPTLASKLRGDYRTGKRLNIKRIIPYIASNYKRDKIWLRRSTPSKRNYQILLAVDDSKSMAESGSGFLALETVALLAKSLTMLEVGEISIVSFGNEDHIRLAHPFGVPFTNDAGPKVFQNFSYAQDGTNVKRLVEESIALFRDARNKTGGGGGSTSADLWQLMLIISDGICEDHEGIRRLVRQAKEERIMIAFIIVDTQPTTSIVPTSSISSTGPPPPSEQSDPSSTTKAPKPTTSILDLSSASFEPDPMNEGEMKLKIKRYLETFPFPYYLVVRDVRELPGVLGTALKGWFQEVVDAA